MNKFTTGIDYTIANDPQGFNIPNENGIFRIVDGVIFSHYLNELLEEVEVETCCSDEYCTCHESSFDKLYRNDFEDNVRDITISVKSGKSLVDELYSSLADIEDGEHAKELMVKILDKISTELNNIEYASECIDDIL